jgi:flagellar biogenesis protein FliO
MTGQEIATMVIGVVALIGFALLAAWLIKAPK